MAELSGESPKYETLRRRLRSRKRDDYALDLFRRIEESLADLRLVDRILLELGRCYNPLTNGPIVDLASRRRIIELLQEGKTDEAREMLDRLLLLYARVEPKPLDSSG